MTDRAVGPRLSTIGLIGWLTCTLVLGGCAHAPDTDPELLSRAVFLEAGDIEALDESGPEVLVAYSSSLWVGSAYAVIVRTNGAVEYFGRRNVVREGYARRSLRPTQLVLLQQLVRNAGVMNARDSYEADFHEYTVLFVREGERTRRVEYPNRGPSRLRTFVKALHSLLGVDRWAAYPSRN